MYSTCIFCHSPLGANDVVEHFPVGRRLAFDAARGRLWAVCRRCERWNLSPLEERWEAIEECERLFSGTRLRVSTDNIGLARAADGLELVRIGSPQRPEMAAWRYGDQFGRRRQRHLALTGAGVAAAVGLVVLGPVTGIIAGGSWGLWNVASTVNSLYQARKVRARILLPGHEELVSIRLKQLEKISIVSEDDEWALRILFEDSEPQSVFNVRSTLATKLGGGVEAAAVLRGDAALRAAGKLLPALNRSGATRGAGGDAVRLIGEASDPASLFNRYSGRPVGRWAGRGAPANATGHVLASLPKEVRLALEMASHEESERRALEGELALLESAWKEAEEIAAISDDLFVSDDLRSRLARLRSTSDRG